jgi:hypothetical protein
MTHNEDEVMSTLEQYRQLKTATIDQADRAMRTWNFWRAGMRTGMRDELPTLTDQAMIEYQRLEALESQLSDLCTKQGFWYPEYDRPDLDLVESEITGDPWENFGNLTSDRRGNNPA